MAGVDVASGRRQRPCPLCRSVASRHLFRQEFAELSGTEFVKGYDVVVCRTCGVAFADGVPEQAAFDRYYRDLSKYEYQHDGGKPSDLDERRFRDIADTIERYTPAKDARILEIGCATGGLLRQLGQRGYTNVQGLDPSPGCAAAAWDLHRVPVTVGSLFGAPVPLLSFDLVILIGVLEHVEDLHGAVDCVRQMLRPRGHVYAEVPDAAHLSGRPDAPFQEFSPEHINFFSTTSLTNLWGLHAFEAVVTGEPVRQQHANTTYPAAFGIYRNGSHRVDVTPDPSTEVDLIRYIEESTQVESRTTQRIVDATRGRRLLVWSAGTHARRLLATGAFDHGDVVAFVDSNPQYQGRRLRGIPVIGPADVSGRSEPILIATRGFQAEIARQIRDRLGIDNEIIRLYEDDDSPHTRPDGAGA